MNTFSGLVGKWFPTGAHKVGAAFGCLVPRLVTGQFDPVSQKAVWPSTGNYCRGGAYDSNLLACESVAILPEGMSAERFHWLESVAGEIIKTPGTESNVKEIFDKCNELRQSGEDLVIFNQFDEFGNYLWHYAVTGPAFEEAVAAAAPGARVAFAGMKYAPWWMAPANLIVRAKARPYMTTLEGLYLLQGLDAAQQAACLAALYTVSQLVVWLGLFAAFVPFIGDRPALAYLRFDRAQGPMQAGAAEVRM